MKVLLFAFLALLGVAFAQELDGVVLPTRKVNPVPEGTVMPKHEREYFDRLPPKDIETDERCGMGKEEQMSSHRRRNVDTVTSRDPYLQEVIPACGEDVCDVPELIEGYVTYMDAGKMSPPTLAVNVIQVQNTGGQKMPTDTQTSQQLTVLNEMYKNYFKFEFYTKTIVSDDFYALTVVPFCDRPGDGQCDDSCDYLTTGFDGGDCTDSKSVWESHCVYGSGRPHTTLSACNSGQCSNNGWTCAPACTSGMTSNGVCDEACNIKEHNYDGGECCLKSGNALKYPGKCRDPSSSNRLAGWMNAPTFKLNVQNVLKNNNELDDGLYAYVKQFDSKDLLLGYATFPWSNDLLGGVFMGAHAWGVVGSFTGVTAAHEIGHCFGLYHVFHGQSEIDSCSHPCYEGVNSASSMTNGDMCSDTTMTPTMFTCSAPDACSSSAPKGCDVCAGTDMTITNDVLKNYMNYGPDSCLNQYTKQQYARQRCYVDLMYGDWMIDDADTAAQVATPSPVVIAPVVYDKDTHYLVAWHRSIYEPSGTKYEVTRTPAFSSAVVVEAPSAANAAVTYSDSDRQEGAKYTITAFVGSNKASPSPDSLDVVVSPASVPMVAFTALVTLIALLF